MFSRPRCKSVLIFSITAFFFNIVLLQLITNSSSIKHIQRETTSREVPTTKSTYQCEDWTKTGFRQLPPYFLVAILVVRIYESDKAKLTALELRQWLQFMQYSGCEHVYIYDVYYTKDEAQFDNLKYFIDNGYVTYIDWSHLAKPYNLHKTKHSAFDHALKVFGKNTTIWQILTDIDEYIFSSEDLEPHYLMRYVKKFQQKYARGSEISISNYLFLGKPAPKEEHSYLTDRLYRITKKRANNLDKQIVQVSKAKKNVVHHSMLSSGISIDVKPSELRLNHYWGARLQNWGEDTKEILEKTQVDESFKPIVDRLIANSNCPPIPNFYTYPTHR